MEKNSKVMKNLFNQTSLESLSVEFIYMRHVNQDEKYKAIEIKASSEIVKWIKKILKRI